MINTQVTAIKVGRIEMMVISVGWQLFNVAHVKLEPALQVVCLEQPGLLNVR